MKAVDVADRQNEGDALFQRLFVKQRCSRLHKIDRWPRWAAHVAIRAYQLSLSMLVGRHCRHWPSCSRYTDEAIQRFGLWRGGWMGAARIYRCHPYGTSGIDIVCEELPADARWYSPWRYGRWRGTLNPEAQATETTEPTGPGAAPGPS